MSANSGPIALGRPPVPSNPLWLTTKCTSSLDPEVWYEHALRSNQY